MRCVLLLLCVAFAAFGFLFGLSMVCNHIGMIQQDTTTRIQLKKRLKPQEALSNELQSSQDERK